MLQTLRSVLRARPDPHIVDEISEIGRRRVSTLAPLLVFVHLAHVIIFWPYTPGASDQTQIWRNGIIAAHLAMLLMVAGFGAVAHMIGRREHRSRESELLAELVALTYLLCGAAVAIVDQLVSPNISALLVSTTGIAVSITVRPLLAAFNYTVAWALFVKVVPWTQYDPNVLLSVRVNSITIFVIGFGVAVLHWHHHVDTLRKKHQIEAHKRELVEVNEELSRLAIRDSLTGLLNRRQFMNEAIEEIARMQSTRRSACLIILDIDHFKRINDTYGHPVGDRVLYEAAGILAQHLRDVDILARVGGEEFAILLPEMSVQDGTRLAEELRSAIAGHAFKAGTQVIHVTASFGVTELSAESHDAFQEGYRLADDALYRAKHDGRDCVRSA